MNADGGDIQLAARGAFIERLDVLQNMLKRVTASINEPFREGIKHKGIIRIGRMAERQLHHRGESGRRGAPCRFDLAGNPARLWQSCRL